MTISTTSNTVVVQGNGLTTSFDFTFPVPLASELFVYYTDATGAVTTLNPSQYSVTGIGTANGGAVTYPLSGSPIASGTSLTIQRIVSYQQLTDLVNQSGYYPNVVENALDYLTMQTQQLAQEQTLAITVPLSASPSNLVLPSAAGRATTLVGFDSSGNVIAYPITASVGAGDLTSEGPFVAGIDFTAGVSTTLTLSKSYGAPANVQVHFDGIYQGTDQYTLTGTQITFTSPIPVGVSKVYIVGGTTLSTNVPADGSVTTPKIQDGAVTSSKIAAGAVGAAQLANGSIGAAQLAWAGLLSKVVTSISALRSLNKATYTNAFVTGYYATNDGGGGAYYLDASDTTSADNGGTIIVAIDGGRWKLIYAENKLSIKQFGAKVDGVTDDSTPVQNCINFLQTNGGGTIFLPAGVTILNTGVTITVGGVTLAGIGWQEYSGVETTGTPGINASWVKSSGTANSPVTIANTVEHATIKDIAFMQAQPADAPGWSPTVYPPTINVVGSPTSSGAVLMERIFCWNCYEFIRVGSVGNFSGRVTMKHVWGQPLSVGINMIASSDTMLLDDIHFWPFATASLNIAAWVQAQGHGINVVRSDNFIANNIFIFGVSVGFLFSSSTDGGTQHFQMSNIGLDSATVGILFSETAGATNGQISNLYVQAPSSAGSNSWGINAASVNNLTLDIVNFRSTIAGAGAVGMSGSADISITNAWADGWNISGIGSPAFNVSSGCTLTLGGRLRVNGGGGAATAGGAGVINMSHVN